MTRGNTVSSKFTAREFFWRSVFWLLVITAVASTGAIFGLTVDLIFSNAKQVLYILSGFIVGGVCSVAAFIVSYYINCVAVFRKIRRW